MFLYREPYSDSEIRHEAAVMSGKRYGHDYPYLNIRSKRVAVYLSLFRLYNPLMYFLWYRFRIRMMLTKSEIRGLSDCGHYHWTSFYGMSLTHMGCMSYWDEFALRHPVLFLFVDAFQFLKKLLTAPSEISRSAEREIAERVEQFRIEQELAQKHG